MIFACQKKSEPNSGIWFALKQMKKSFVVSNGCYEEVLRELHFLRHVRSPFLCNAYYAFQSPAHLYLVMDLALGGDLRAYMDQTGKLPPEQVRIVGT